MKWMKAHLKPVLLLLSLLGSFPVGAAERHRFFYEGDGAVKLYNPKVGQRTEIRYRHDEAYPVSARVAVDQLFGLNPTQQSVEHISLRLIALLDYIQDTFGDSTKTIQLDSAYRAPQYNQSLRDKGRTVAKASTHMEGMAADITISGVSGKSLWEQLRDKNCCGVGWYGKNSVHVDSGPARWWTGKTSKVKTNISDANKQVVVRTDYDVYQPGEVLELAIVRITSYPLGIRPEFELARGDAETGRVLKRLKASFANKAGTKTNCLKLENRKEARRVQLTLPKRIRDAEGERLHLRLHLCEPVSEETPAVVYSNQFVIKQ